MSIKVQLLTDSFNCISNIFFRVICPSELFSWVVEYDKVKGTLLFHIALKNSIAA